VQRGRWQEHEDGDGRSLDKKDGSVAHRGSGADEVADGAGGEGGRLNEEEGRRVSSPEEGGAAGVAALQPNSVRGRGPGAQAPSGRGRGVKGVGWVCSGGRSWERKGRGGGGDRHAL
jgi:hypothetical protein